MNIEMKLGKQTYRIRKYDSLNIVVEKLVEVDPTKSPAFDETKHSSELRYEYREPKYYSSLELAIKSLLDRSIIDSDSETLAALLEETKQFKREIKLLMSVEGI